MKKKIISYCMLLSILASVLFIPNMYIENSQLKFQSAEAAAKKPVQMRIAPNPTGPMVKKTEKKYKVNKTKDITTFAAGAGAYWLSGKLNSELARGIAAGTAGVVGNHIKGKDIWVTASHYSISNEYVTRNEIRYQFYSDSKRTKGAGRITVWSRDVKKTKIAWRTTVPAHESAFSSMGYK